MQSAVITPELIQRNLQRLVNDSAMSTQALSVVSGIPHPTLTRKLAQTDCAFSVREVASITMALGYKIEVVFADQPDIRHCPNEPCIETSHEWVHGEQNGPCENHRFVGRNDDCDYIVWVQKWPDEGWFADGEISGASKGEPGLELIDSYRRDFAQAVAIAARLNEIRK